MSQRKPYPKNVDGPFYVEDGCCTSCLVWEEEGSEFLRLVEDGVGWHCYFYRQPVSKADHEKVFAAMDVAELDCMRYRGTDRGILQRMVDRGEASQCDHLEEELP